MSVNSENWQDYPYLVEWVESANKWAKQCEIYEFMPADDQGLDPSGQFSQADGYPGLPKFTTQSTGGYGGDGSLVWTFYDGSERSILSEFFIGAGSSWATIGWYLGRIPHTDKVEGFEQQKKVCSICEDQGGYFVSDSEDEVECLACLESPVWINLEHSVGPDGLMTFTGSAFWRG
jgi:hypothetical protein